jgi:hypothetical protein
MNPVRLTFTITKAAALAGMDRILERQNKAMKDGLSIDIQNQPKDLDHTAFILNQACLQANLPEGLTEVLDTRHQDTETYLGKLEIPGCKLIGIFCREFRKRDTEWAGSNGWVLITVCTYYEAHKSFASGGWKSMDGKKVELLPEIELGTQAKQCQGICQKVLPLGEFRLSKGYRRNKCKSCYYTDIRSRKNAGISNPDTASTPTPEPFSEAQELVLEAIKAEAQALQDLLASQNKFFASQEALRLAVLNLLPKGS